MPCTTAADGRTKRPSNITKQRYEIFEYAATQVRICSLIAAIDDPQTWLKCDFRGDVATADAISLLRREPICEGKLIKFTVKILKYAYMHKKF
jgi:hypothetical protein